MSDPSDLLLKWCDCFKRGNDFDAWGQFVEASEQYNRLFRQIRNQLVSENQLFLDEQKKLLAKIAVCLERRSKSLQNSQEEQFSLEDLRLVYPVLEKLLSEKKIFPITIEIPDLHFQREYTYNLTLEDDFHNDQENVGGGTLLPRIPFQPKCHRLTIRIVQIGLKDPVDYINPFMTVSIKDLNGNDLTTAQDTPISKIKENSSIPFRVDVELQKVIEELPKESAVFFEFKYFKPKKNLVSTKCWAFMELDELKAGPACIELYKKPTDSLRKKINLLTVKPLYLHLHLTIDDYD